MKKKNWVLAIILVILILAIAIPVMYIRLNPYYDEISSSEVCSGDVQIAGTCHESRSYKNINNKYICLLNGGRWGSIQQCGFAGCEEFTICSANK